MSFDTIEIRREMTATDLLFAAALISLEVKMRASDGTVLAKLSLGGHHKSAAPPAAARRSRAQGHTFG